MADTTPPKVKPGGNFLTRKAGPLPVWAWGAIVIGAYLVYRNYKAGSATLATTPSAGGTTGAAGTGTDTSGSAGGGTGGSSAGDQTGAQPYDPYQVLYDQLVAAQPFPSGSQAAAASPLLGQDTAANTFKPVGVTSNAAGSIGHESQVTPQQLQTAVNKAASNAGSSPSAQPFGGVVSSKKLANGATLITYKSGRQVEQAPGKTPYVVKK